MRTAISRSVIDVNRDPSGASLYPGQATTELCPTTTFDGEPLYAGAAPDEAEIARRRSAYFEPYHAALAAEIARLRKRHAKVVLYEAHSIRSRIPRLFDGELPNFNLGTNSGASCSPELTASVEAACDASGKTYTVSGKGTKEPENPADGQLFLKVNNIQKPYSSENVLEVYNEASGNWSAIELKWCRIEAGGIGKNFAVWDTVTVSGVEDGDDLHWKELKGDRIVTARGDDWVQVQAEPGGDYFYGTLTKGREMLRWTGIDGKGATMEGNTDAFRLERRVPDLDYLTECDNRLWGCAQNENVIYGCKLGDPTNWFSYRGIAEDSYAVTVGSDGPFTGAATCLGSVLFFKENALHKLYGSKPSDFQLSSLRCRGVARNAASSLCVLNETLYYLSPDGVMAWDGSIPTKVSEKLNTARLSNVQTAVGGALDGRYYLYLARDSGREGDALEERLLVYDTERGLWQEEDGCSYAMASTGGQLYLWDGHDIWAADPSRERDWKTTEGVEETVDFELITGAFGMDEAEDRYLSRLTLQMDAVCTSNVELAICYDDGPWEKLAEWAVAGKQKRFDLHLAPRRCGMFRLRLTGKGKITLRSLARTLATARGRLMEQEA